MKKGIRKVNIAVVSRTVTILLVAVLMVMTSPVSFAITPLNTGTSVNLSVECVRGGAPLNGMHYALYYIGDVSSDAQITLRPPFADSFSVSESKSRSQWDQIAFDMKRLCDEEGITPVAEASTNQNGVVSFGVHRDLSCGLYLVVGEDFVQQNVRYSSLPFLVLLPSWNAESLSWEYAVHATPKIGEELLPTESPEPSASPTPTPTPTGTPGVVNPPKLPQTGLLWWPVLPLLFCGIAFSVFGIIRKRSGNRRSGTFMILLGICCLLVLMTIFAFNMCADAKAGISAAKEKDALVAAVLPDYTDWPTPDFTADSGVIQGALKNIGTGIVQTEEKPYIEMPVKKINGVDYVALLSIQDLDLELPIRAFYDMRGLQYSPERYSGSAYMGDLVLCAHNYSQHFGRLKDLKEGNEILLVDMDGNLFRYAVVLIEILQPGDVDAMKQSEYDLSLFTCTLGGAARVTVRCRLTDFQPASTGVSETNIS